VISRNGKQALDQVGFGEDGEAVQGKDPIDMGWHISMHP